MPVLLPPIKNHARQTVQETYVIGIQLMLVLIKIVLLLQQHTQQINNAVILLPDVLLRKMEDVNLMVHAQLLILAMPVLLIVQEVPVFGTLVINVLIKHVTMLQVQILHMIYVQPL